MCRNTSRVAVASTAVAAALALPAGASAAFTAGISGNTGTLQGDAAAETITIGSAGGVLSHGRQTAGDPNFASDVDWDTLAAGEQTLAANGSTAVVVNLGDGADRFDPAAIAGLQSLVVDGGPGDDNLFGSNGVDDVRGGDGHDLLSPGSGSDTLSGGPGDDIFVWTNGGGADKITGDDGFDRSEVNGSPSGETFTVAADGPKRRLERAAPGAVSLDLDVELLDVRGNAGNDSVTDTSGLPLTADGGVGDDGLTGGSGADLLLGGPGIDTIDGGTGFDVADGGPGNDALRLRDGGGDVGRCGADTDSAQSDAADVLDACEQVDAAPGPGPAAAPDTKGLPVTIGKPGKVKSGKVPVKITCPAAETGGCNGTIQVATAKRVSAGGARVIAILGSAKLKLSGGQVRTVSLKLASGWTRYLSRKGSLSVLFTATTKDAAGNLAQATKKGTLKR